MTKAVDAIAPTDVRDWQFPFTGWRGIFFSSQNCCSKVLILSNFARIGRGSAHHGQQLTIVAKSYPTSTESKKHCHRRVAEHVSSLTLCLSKNLIARANSSSRKRATETASVSHDEEHQHAVISFADGAKVSLRSSASQPDRQEIANKTLILLQRYNKILRRPRI